MNLYIDTNIYLDFYHFSKGDLDELEKLTKLIKNQEITLYLPQQTKDEFIRNREKTINHAINSLKEQKFKAYPQIVKDYAEYNKLKEIEQEYKKT